MTNKSTHQNHALVFSSQSHLSIEQILASSGLVHTARRTTDYHPTREPRLNPLNVDSDISRVSARLPADRRGERPDHPAHTDPSVIPSIQPRTDTIRAQTRMSQSNEDRDTHQRQVVTLIQFDSNVKSVPRANTLRPGTEINLQTSGDPNSRGVHHHPEMIPTSQEILERPLGGVRQDKDRFASDRAASLQPAAVKEFTRSQSTSRKSARLQKDNGDNRRAPIQVWAPAPVKDQLARIAASEGLSLSAAGAAFLTRGLQQNVDMQYGALLNPVIEKAIARQMSALATRLTWLLVRIAFDAGQTRSLVTNILGRQKGVTQPVLKTLIDSSERSAKANIMRRTPQITDLINSVEQWMTEDSRGVGHKKSHD